MRILVINWRCIKNPLAGGAEIYFQEIFRRIVKKGYAVTQLAVKYPGAQENETIDGIKIIRIGTPNTFNFAVYREVPHILAEQNFDLVIDDLNKIPFFSPWLTKKPVLALMMHLFRKSIFKEVSFPLASYVYLAESLIPLCYKNNYFVAISESSKKDLINIGIAAPKIFVIPPGVDLNLYKPNFALKGEKIILHVGRLKRYKSIDHLLYATKELSKKRRDFQVVILGTGDDEVRLKDLTMSLGIKDLVTFSGYVTEEEKIKYYQKAKVLVENSIKEGWGMIVIEANACGTPVIAAKSPGLTDAVCDGVSGYLYEYGNIKELTEKIELLLDNDELNYKMANAGINWAKNFSWESSAEAMFNLINKVV
ncbi:MAG: glycosyltransferase family 4 protein [candidate division WOR-3 bacterium]|nr:glycosyltransferase family 4 protein [candidate division WOR-3 bacterium]MCX7757897.1 glycosyltransferase family 4 protein [candidate division WOR-3 bacterium]MDW7987352.1 glycosyltransferase family 4 protein [candidate division WOR-3 bacterium]